MRGVLKSSRAWHCSGDHCSTGKNREESSRRTGDSSSRESCRRLNCWLRYMFIWRDMSTCVHLSLSSPENSPSKSHLKATGRRWRSCQELDMKIEKGERRESKKERKKEKEKKKKEEKRKKKKKKHKIGR